VVKHNQEMMEGDCVTVESDLVTLVGRRLGALATSAAAQCPPRTALVSWAAKTDPRPWYARRAEPGKYSFEAECCPALQLDVCKARSYGCTLKTKYGVDGIVATKYPHAECDPSKDEVMTSWQLTTEGCPEGFLQVQTTCCITPQFYDLEGDGDNITAANQALLVAVKQGGSDADLQQLKSKVSDFSAGDETRTGPLLDSMTVQEGASYVPRHLSGASDATAAAGKSWAKESFEAISQGPGDADASNARRFCEYKEVKFPNDWSTLLQPCKPEQGTGGHLRAGNVFLRVSTKLGVGFSGDWKFRAESHAFKGALVVEQHGGGVVASHDIVRYNSKVGRCRLKPIATSVESTGVSS
jgi:hypothetical protein